MANIFTIKFKVRDDPEDKAFTIDIPYQDKVSDVTQKVKAKLATRLEEESADDINLYSEYPINSVLKPMQPEENFFKGFDRDHTNAIIIIIIIVKLPPPSIPKKKEWIIIYINHRLEGIFRKIKRVASRAVC